MKNSRWRWLFVLSICGAASIWHVACKARRGDSESTQLSEEERKKLDEARAEMEIGRNMAGRLLQFYGTYEDKKLVTYINQLGAFVAKYGDYPDRRYMFEIIDTDMVNAFACPGGYILVTLGAIRHARNEAELAAVLGHETVHVGKKHMFDTLKNMNSEEMQKIAKEAEEKNSHMPPEVAARKRPDPAMSDTGALLARYLSGSAAGLSILAAAKAGMSLILEKGLGADLEYEADREGVKYAIRAGYHPPALQEYLCRLAKKDKVEGHCELPKVNAPKKAETILEKTHPPAADRIANIDKVLKELNASEIVGAKGVKRLKLFTANLPAPKNQKTAASKTDESKTEE